MNDKYQTKDMTGALWVNERRRTPKHPVMTGTCHINGEELRMAVWSNTDRNGRKYWSVKFSEPTEEYAKESYVHPDESDLPPIDDEIRF